MPTVTLAITSSTPLIASSVPKPTPRTSVGNRIAAVLLSVVSYMPMYKPEKQKTIANSASESPGTKSSAAGTTASE
jgi:hypothetical protein